MHVCVCVCVCVCDVCLFIYIYMLQVVVECLSSGLSQVFLCNAWLDRSEGDGLIERELYELDNCRQMRKASKLHKKLDLHLECFDTKTLTS